MIYFYSTIKKASSRSKYKGAFKRDEHQLEG